jgi:hypothetical protein
VQNDYGEAVGRLNAGEPIAPVDASLIERAWKALSQLDAIQRNSAGIQLGAVAGNDSNASALSPDQRLAFSVRYALLDALLKRGILDAFMEDAKLRCKVFAAAASLPCDKNDIGEASFLRRLRESPPDIVKKMTEEARQAGYDPEHPKLDEKFIAWMNANDEK